jgi:hypothetical protein
MKTYLAAIALAAALAQPAAATTFPALTTIYVATGVKDTGGVSNAGAATAIQCSNVSGVTTSIRFLLLDASGAVIAFNTAENVAHGATVERSTHSTVAYTNETFLLGSAGATISSGVLNIESTQSGVFCTAAIIDAAAAVPDGVSLHLVRINPHPGSVE